MYSIKTKYVECGCHDPNHTIMFQLDKGDGEFPRLYVRTQMASFGFWRRLTNSFKYLFRLDAAGWEEALIEEQNISEIRDLLNEYELSLNEYWNR